MASWDDYLHSQQNNDGIQMTWNVWPHSRVDAQKLVVPVTTFFTPLKVTLLFSLFFYYNKFFFRKNHWILHNNHL